MHHAIGYLLALMRSRLRATGDGGGAAYADDASPPDHAAGAASTIPCTFVHTWPLSTIGCISSDRAASLRQLADGGAGVRRGGSKKDGGGGVDAGGSGGRGVSRLHLQWLGLHAFVVVLRRKHARYGASHPHSAERAELGLGARGGGQLGKTA